MNTAIARPHRSGHLALWTIDAWTLGGWLVHTHSVSSARIAALPLVDSMACKLRGFNRSGCNTIIRLSSQSSASQLKWRICEGGVCIPYDPHDPICYFVPNIVLLSAPCIESCETILLQQAFVRSSSVSYLHSLGRISVTRPQWAQGGPKCVFPFSNQLVGVRGIPLRFILCYPGAPGVRL